MRRLLALCVSLVACTGSLQPHVVDAGPPGEVDAGAAPLDTSTPDAPEEDAAASPDVQRDLVSAPLPASVARPKQIVVGHVELAGEGETSCTNQTSPSGNGDRWCVFRRPASDGKNTELWVIDVTRAMAGAVPPCDGTSPSCLRMTQTLWTDEPILGPRQWKAHRFDGDTLLFHADASSGPDDPYTGPIYAWRPGWTKPRLLASKAYACYGHSRLPLALCIDNITYDVAVPVEYDLRAGTLDDPAGGVLPLVDHPKYSRAERQQGSHVAFSDDGQYLAYTNAATLESPTPALRVLKLGSGTPAQDVLQDVISWDLSFDGTRIVYLAEFSDGVGRLATADFPSGANPHISSLRALRYVLLRGANGEDRGVGYFAEPGGRFLSEYSVIHDLDLATSPTVVFRYTNPLEDFHLSRDGQYTGYAKADPTEGFNGYLVRGDGVEQCILNTERNQPAFEYYFLDDSSLVFWSEESPESSDFQDGWFGRPEGCRDHRLFARQLAFYMPMGTEGLLFGDELDLANDTFTLKYAALQRGEWPSVGAVRIHGQAAFPVALLAPAMRELVFSVKGPTDGDSGLFVFDLASLRGLAHQ